jgi:DNA-binding NarL/FixJ family response regulator
VRTEIIHITEKNINRLCYESLVGKNGTTNKDKIAIMKNILFSALENELTHMQRLCLVEHYLNGKKGKDIAFEHNLNPSTVSRHISKAKSKLKHIASYYI